MVAILHEFKVRLQAPPKTFDIHPVFRPTLENRLFVLGQLDSSSVRSLKFGRPLCE
jgi:hypothetical protein